MKKLAVFFFLIFITTIKITAQTPTELKGIWQNDDRYIFFGENNEIAIVLKLFYSWYADRAVEPNNFSEIYSKHINDATSANNLNYSVKYEKKIENLPIWDITILENEKIISTIPIAIINNEIYLNFLVKETNQNEIHPTEYKYNSQNKIPVGFWKGINYSENIRISPRNNQENLISWYFTENAIYKLRFWQTDMIHNQEESFFSDSNQMYAIPKHILSAGINYTCANGKSSHIRNVEKFTHFPETFTLDTTLQICGINKANFTKVNDINDAKELLKFVNKLNSRRKPLPKPLFPPSNLDWHWDLINNLEKNNKQIQAVRQRQQKFGPRGKEVEEK